MEVTLTMKKLNSSPSNLNRKRSSDENISPISSSKRARFYFLYRRQIFSLPDSIIYYITKNPSSSECYQKMIQSCKYFFIKNPILIVPDFRIEYKNNSWETVFDETSVNFESMSSKIWILNGLTANENNQANKSWYSLVAPKIHQCDAEELILWKQTIALNDFKFLASKCEKIRLNKVTVMEENGSVVALEKLVALLSKVKHLRMCFSDLASAAVTSNTVTELLKIPHFSTLKYFHLFDIPETFDILTFHDYIQKNKNTKIMLDFCNQISGAYKEILQQIVNELLNTQNRGYKVPFIRFPGFASLNLFNLYR